LRPNRGTAAIYIGAIAKPDEVRFAEALPKTGAEKSARLLKSRERSNSDRGYHDPGRSWRFEN
jgi:acyl-coenzyme A synthetase/AMP-(fatty) acid ligase